MSGRQVPHAAFCEEYDEDAHTIIPETRRVAHVTTARRSNADLKRAIEGGSDSGYSSRTAATANSRNSQNSAQSAPSGRKGPVALKFDSTLSTSTSTSTTAAATRKPDLDKARTTATATSSSSRKDRVKDRSARPVRHDKMQVGSYSSSSHPHLPPQPPPPPSSSKPRRRERETTYVRHYPGTCWECEQGLYHAATSTPVEPLAIEYPYYASPHQATPVHEFPPPTPSPSTPHYPPSVVEDVHVSHSSRPVTRTGRSNSYHTNRPVSFHGAMPGMGSMIYNVPPPPHMNHYEHGPPPSSSAYANTPTAYAPSQYPHHHQSHYYVPDYVDQPPRERSGSISKPRDQQPRSRRASVYGPPVLDYDPPTPTYGDEEPLEDRRSSREPRAPMPPPPPPHPSHSSHSVYDPDEDYYRMPPPPRPPTIKKHTPRIIQKRPDLPRKSATTAVVPKERRPSKTFDLSEMEAALPERRYRRLTREAALPERSHSMNEGRRTTSYHESSSRLSRMNIENSHSRRRRPQTYYHYDSSDMDEKQREAEKYQAARSGKGLPLVTDALVNASKESHALDSDSSSEKSNSSRGSDAPTQSGSGVVSKADDENSIVMTMNGVTMSFTQESVGGKKISVRTGDTGAVELNIEGKRPKKYLTSRSDHSASGNNARKELEDLRRPRDDRRSDRASRRSSRSTYGARFYD